MNVKLPFMMGGILLVDFYRPKTFTAAENLSGHLPHSWVVIVNATSLFCQQ